MAYTKTTWVDEVLAGAERFKILDNVGVAVDAFADLANCEIALNVGITTAGTTLDASHMNNIENGIYDLSRGAALSVKGITGNATGDVADIAAGVDGYVLRRSGTTLGFGQVATAGIADLAITAAKIANTTITGSQLASGAVTAGKIGTGGISATTQFAAQVVNAAAIVNATITGTQLAAGAVTAGKIGVGGISAANQFAAGVVDSNAIGSGNVSYANLSAGASKLIGRKGGSATDWWTSGDTSQSISGMKVECGSAGWSGSAANNGSFTLNYPTAFANAPLIFFSGMNKICFWQSSPLAGSCSIYWRTIDDTTITSLTCFWLAIGY